MRARAWRRPHPFRKQAIAGPSQGAPIQGLAFETKKSKSSAPMAELAPRGAFTALVTPFERSGDRIDWAAYERLLEGQIAAKIDGLVPCGTTGEAPTLSKSEQSDLIKRTVDFCGGRVPVIAGTGTNGTQSSVARAKEAFRVGADAVMVVAPYYNRPSQEGLFRHVEAISAAVSGPVVLYNVPARSAVAFDLDTICRIIECCANVVALKDASAGVTDCQELTRRLGDRLAVFCGDDALTVPLMSVGATGVISVTSNVAPRPVKRVVELMRAGEYSAARDAHLALLPVHRAMFCVPSPAPVKAVLAARGQMNDTVRLPLVAATEAQRQHILSAVQEVGTT